MAITLTTRVRYDGKTFAPGAVLSDVRPAVAVRLIASGAAVAVEPKPGPKPEPSGAVARRQAEEEAAAVRRQAEEDGAHKLAAEENARRRAEEDALTRQAESKALEAEVAEHTKAALATALEAAGVEVPKKARKADVVALAVTNWKAVKAHLNAG